MSIQKYKWCTIYVHNYFHYLHILELYQGGQKERKKERRTKKESVCVCEHYTTYFVNMRIPETRQVMVTHTQVSNAQRHKVA